MLLVDTPPGTSDEHLSIVQYLAGARLRGAVVVTTPQEIALQDVRKEITFCRKVEVPVLGLVENMAMFVCPSCHLSSSLLPASTGGAVALGEEVGVQVLARLPLDPLVGRACDQGESLFVDHGGTDVAAAYRRLTEALGKCLQS